MWWGPLLLALMFASNKQPSSHLTSLLGSYLAGWCEYSGYGMAIRRWKVESRICKKQHWIVDEKGQNSDLIKKVQFKNLGIRGLFTETFFTL